MLDAAVVFASRAVLHDSAGVHAMEPSANHRVFLDRDRGPQAPGRRADGSSGSLRRRESSHAVVDRTERAAGVSAAAAAPASADVGATHHRALDKMGGRARSQWLFHRRAKFAPEKES